MRPDEVERAALMCVGGGSQNRTIAVTRDGQMQDITRTDYAMCLEAVSKACASANPGWVFGTNRRAAALCELKYLPACAPVHSP